MNITSISNLKFMAIYDDAENSFHGCSQEWYSDQWQKICGCGPTTACNIIWYLGHLIPSIGLNATSNSKRDCISLMEDVWKYVKPTAQGIPETKLFSDAVLAYALSKGVHLEYRACDLPKNRAGRPDLSEVVEFLAEGLRSDAPIAFLNLCNGQESNLEAWHWVTMVSLESSGMGTDISTVILDGGLIKKINLTNWYRTTTLGGGFVYFTGQVSSALKGTAHFSST